MLKKNYGNFFEKSGSVFALNAVEREPIPTRVLYPKTCGVQGRSPGRGCGGSKPPRKKKVRKKKNLTKKKKKFKKKKKKINFFS